jgi:hypothetical protein
MPSSPNALDTLKDPKKVPWESIAKAIESSSSIGTFRGCLDGDWLPLSPDPMVWQRTGGLAAGLKRVGVDSIVVGDLSEEWYLYAIAHPITCPTNVRENLLRYYPSHRVDDLLKLYQPPLSDKSSQEECFKRFGEALSAGQVHVPVRVLARDLKAANYPVLRYAIHWTPPSVRTLAKGTLETLLCCVLCS